MRRPTMVVLGFMFGVSACDDGDEPEYVQSCELTCKRAADCSSTVDARRCNDDCQDQFSDVGPKLSRAYLDGIERCLSELSCNEFVVSTATNACGDEAAARLKPSKAAEDLCERVVDSYRECASLTVSGGLCLDTVKIFDDGTLRRASRCDDEPCDRRADCLMNALGTDVGAN